MRIELSRFIWPQYLWKIIQILPSANGVNTTSNSPGMNTWNKLE